MFLRKYDNKCISWQTRVDGLRRLREAQRDFAKKHRLSFMDVESKVPKDLEHFVDQVHYTEKGTELVGRILCEEVMRSGILLRLSSASSDERTTDQP